MGSKSALAIEAAQRLGQHCIDNGGNPEGVHDDLTIIEDPLRRYQKLEQGNCSTTIIENDGREVDQFPVRCEQIWVSSRGWFSTTVFTPPENEAHLWTKYTLGGDAV